MLGIKSFGFEIVTEFDYGVQDLGFLSCDDFYGFRVSFRVIWSSFQRNKRRQNSY